MNFECEFVTYGTNEKFPFELYLQVSYVRND